LSSSSISPVREWLTAIKSKFFGRREFKVDVKDSGSEAGMTAIFFRRRECVECKADVKDSGSGAGMTAIFFGRRECVECEAKVLAMA